MKLKKPVIFLTLITALAGLAAGMDAKADEDPPSAEAVAFAQRTSDLMTNTVVAALLQEINETTVDNVQEGNLSIGLVFDDANPSMRLVGTLDPLSENDRPRDDFEEDALDLALAGQPYTDVQRVQGKWYYRRSIPLSNFAPQCALCHDNFVGMPSTELVGALMLRVPITQD